MSYWFSLSDPNWFKIRKQMQTSPCSETTQPISMKPSPFDPLWSETVPLLIIFWFRLQRFFFFWGGGVGPIWTTWGGPIRKLLKTAPFQTTTRRMVKVSSKSVQLFRSMGSSAMQRYWVFWTNHKIIFNDTVSDHGGSNDESFIEIGPVFFFFNLVRMYGWTEW